MSIFDLKKRDVKGAVSNKGESYSDGDFDLASLEGSRFGNAMFSLVGVALKHVVFPLMQRFKPVVSLFGYSLVVRYEDVKTVLGTHQEFEVPFGEKMEKMTAGPVFALGDDGAEHELQIGIALKAWDQNAISGTALEVLDKVVPALLEDSGGDIDVATDVLMRGMSEACIASFGLTVPDADKFAAYATACSIHLFANPGNSDGPRTQGMIGAKRIREILDSSITAYERNPNGVKTRGFLHELMDVQSADDPKRHDRTRAILFGFITGFVPTTSLAAGKILLYLRGSPERMATATQLARQAQQTGDVAQFTAFLLEVSRHNPALFPGQNRRRNLKVADPNWPQHLKRIPAGNLVIASTIAALHDASVMTYPRQFAPGMGLQMKKGGEADNLLFGFGFHSCFGTQLAHDLIPVVLGHVLARSGIAFSPKRPRFISAYAGELRMTFDVEAGHRTQTMLNALLPLRPSSDPEQLIDLLERMNQDDHPAMAVFRDSGIVHFSSLTAINLGPGDNLTSSPTHLMVELNMDGGEDEALNRLAGMEDRAFTELLTYVVWQGTSFFEAVRSGILRPGTRPWGTIGVNFPGTSDMSVKQIEAEKELYAKAQQAMQDARYSRARSEKRSGGHESVSQIFENVRRDLAQDPRFEAMFYRPSDRYPAFARHTEVTFPEFLTKYILPKRRVFLIGAYIAATLLVSLGVAWCVGWIAADLTYVSLWSVPWFLALTLVLILVAILRRKETQEIPDKSIAPHDHLRRVEERENRPGYVQNHITSVSTLKPGLFRKLTTAVAFDLILNMVLKWFRPGFVTDFATIHYARWVRPKGIDKLIFQSNYDGSWESYLEDFITKVHAGQTMAWNNCIGFPRTNWFSNDGAVDGDGFKRWVRLQQVPMQFWFSRFPDLTTGMMRTNAQVRDGLARAQSYDEHKAWLSLFESVPNPENAIDTAQVQTLLFRGLGQHGRMKARLLHFGDPAKAKTWLGKMASEASIADSPVTPEQGQLSFGDSYPNGTPSFLALSASGLKRLGLPDGTFDGFPTLPHAFVDGMARRQFILGDVDSKAKPLLWRWSDVEGNERSPTTAHALLLIYARNKSQMQKAEENIDQDLTEAGIETIHEVHSKRGREKGSKEMAFGFNDGISQPIMRGTQAHAAGKSSIDNIVGPGEFILGYPDSREHVPLPVTVSAAKPAAMCLPAVDNVVQGMVAHFGKGANGLMDFGRNGSFLVVRQFTHNEKAFKAFAKGGTDRKDAGGIESLRAPSLPSEARASIATTEKGRQMHMEEWIGAKMFGRWKDGSSLTRNPSISATTRRRSRYHKQIVEALETHAEDVNADCIELLAEHLQRFISPEESGGAVDDQSSYHVDWVIWTDADWKRFREHVDLIEKELQVPLNVSKALAKAIKPDNDFRHGSDDPQGLSCPFGSHIRRANPRDSFRPGSEVTLEINNRHRLLRRGRTFTKTVEGAVDEDQVNSGWVTRSDTGKPCEDGTFFMCFNANLERQFEFVQQTWVDSRVFHGGREGPDPIVSSKRPGDRFVIPGAASGAFLDLHGTGADEGAWNFVKVVAGGYFFMPSRQALEYLSRL